MGLLQDLKKAADAKKHKEKEKAKELKKTAKLEKARPMRRPANTSVERCACAQKAAKFAKRDAKKDDRKAKAAIKRETDPEDLRKDADAAAEAEKHLSGVPGLAARISKLALHDLAARLRASAGYRAHSMQPHQIVHRSRPRSLAECRSCVS
jgi:hypothetical protein